MTATTAERATGSPWLDFLSSRAEGELCSPLPAEAVKWFERTQQLRWLENHLLLNHSVGGGEELSLHRVFGSIVIAEGERLAWLIRSARQDLSAVGFTVDDIEAEVALVRESFRNFHEAIPQTESEAVLEVVFGQ